MPNCLHRCRDSWTKSSNSILNTENGRKNRVVSRQRGSWYVRVSGSAWQKSFVPLILQAGFLEGRILSQTQVDRGRTLLKVDGIAGKFSDILQIDQIISMRAEKTICR